MKRQAMEITPKELIDKAFELIIELKEIDKDIGITRNYNNLLNQKCQINIINKTKESDKWKFEK